MINRITYGLEFEVENISPRRASARLDESGIPCEYVDEDIHSTNETWKAVHDGSLNNGAEVVSPILNNARLNEASKVARVLSENGATVGRSTGFHVHVGEDVFPDRDTLGLFVLNYYAVHHATGALVAPSRLINRYCRVLNKASATESAEWLASGNDGAPNGDRYCSLNLEALRRHGTIEVRLHQGTLNGVKAVAWAKFISALIETTVKGTVLDEVSSLDAWAPLDGWNRGTRSIESCDRLLDFLVKDRTLEPSAGDWLKMRARHLGK